MKENVAELNKKNIAEGAEPLFLKKGFHVTTIQDISEASQYSRRTIYKYFESKEEILYFLMIQGLGHLVQGLKQEIDRKKPFLETYTGICSCLLDYYQTHPLSAKSVNEFDSGDSLQITPSVERIFALGTEMNELLASWMRQGQAEGLLQEAVDVMMAVYLLSTNLHALFELATSKGPYLFTALQTDQESFLSQGCKMNLNMILKEPLSIETK